MAKKKKKLVFEPSPICNKFHDVKDFDFQNNEFIRSKKFLNTFQWRKLRMEIIKEQGARCQCCGASPKDGVTINVDHIKPRATNPELALVKSNLQVLCGACNHGKSNWDKTDWKNYHDLDAEFKQRFV